MHLKHRKFWTHIRKMISNINQTERAVFGSALWLGEKRI